MEIIELNTQVRIPGHSTGQTSHTVSSKWGHVKEIANARWELPGASPTALPLDGFTTGILFYLTTHTILHSSRLTRRRTALRSPLFQPAVSCGPRVSVEFTDISIKIFKKVLTSIKHTIHCKSKIYKLRESTESDPCDIFQIQYCAPVLIPHWKQHVPLKSFACGKPV